MLSWNAVLLPGSSDFESGKEDPLSPGLPDPCHIMASKSERKRDPSGNLPINGFLSNGVCSNIGSLSEHFEVAKRDLEPAPPPVELSSRCR